MCGEKKKAEEMGATTTASPPRMRGKAFRVGLAGRILGITPAYAGKRQPSAQRMGKFWDHPRVCGEKRVGSLASLGLSGSPPRMRGKEISGFLDLLVEGITPAYAGKSTSASAASSASGDHPRVCGEKFHPASDRKLGRVRGTKRSSGPAPAAAPAGLAGSCPASPPWSYPPRITVSRPRP